MSLRDVLPRIRFPNINPVKFGTEWMLGTARTTAEEEVWPVLDAIGPEWMQRLIDKGDPLHEHIDFAKVPESWTAATKTAVDYKWIVDVLEPADILTLLPEWLQVLILRNDESIAWYMREIKFWLALIGVEKELSDDGLKPTTPTPPGDDPSGAGDDNAGGQPGRFVPIGKSETGGEEDSAPSGN